MELILKRRPSTGLSTIGELFDAGKRLCYILEDAVRTEKIPGKTAIPAGCYRIVIDWSPRFKKLMLHLLDVPNFVGVRIHSGNTAKDTEGCLITGTSAGVDYVSGSVAALAVLSDHIAAAICRGENCWLTIL